MINWLTIVLIVVVFGFSIWLIYRYASRQTPYHIYAFVFIGYFFSFFVIVVLPFDVYSDINGSSDPELIDMWLVVYWASFALCWFILPLTKEFEMAGEFTILGKIGKALYRCVRFYIVMGVFGLVVIIYLAAADPGALQHSWAFLIIFGNCFGLFQIIMFLGYGLVAVPRSLWKQGNLERTYDIACVKAVFLEETKYDAKLKLEECVRLAVAAHHKAPRNSALRRNAKSIIQKCPEVMVEKHKKLDTAKNSNVQEQLGLLNDKRVALIHRNFKRCFFEF
jgi:hypothetical protein